MYNLSRKKFNPKQYIVLSIFYFKFFLLPIKFRIQYYIHRGVRKPLIFHFPTIISLNQRKKEETK